MTDTPCRSGQFRVIKSFYLDRGILAPAGKEITLSDPVLIIELLANGKIYPANASTASRIKPLPSVWGESKSFHERFPRKLAGITKAPR